MAIEVKFCTAKRTHVPVGPAKFDVNWCNESPLRGEKPHFWPVSKFNTSSLPLCGILLVMNLKLNAQLSDYRLLYLDDVCDIVGLIRLGEAQRRRQMNDTT